MSKKEDNKRSESSKENDANASSTYQCMGCAFKLEAETAPEECPKCHSQLSFAKVSDWRFF